METAQQFCLRWNNYQSTLHHVFHKLWINRMFVDVSLVVEGKKIDCHKVILSACSTYFEHLLSEHSSHPHPLILLHDIPFSAVESLVYFMYKGEVNVSHEQLTALLKVAESLKIKGLADSAAISNFTKYRLISHDVTQALHTSYPSPIAPAPAPTPVPTSSHSLSTVEKSMNAYSLPTPLIRDPPSVEPIKRSESYMNGPNPPQKKRLRQEEAVESLPPSPPISLGDPHNNEVHRVSPHESTKEQKVIFVIFAISFIY